MDTPESPSVPGSPTGFSSSSSHEDENTAVDLRESEVKDEYLLFELQSLRSSYESLEAEFKSAETNLVNAQIESDGVQKQNAELLKLVEELKSDIQVYKKENLEFKTRIEDWMREKEGLEREIYEGMGEREELVRRIDVGIREREELVRRIDVGIREREELVKEIEGYKKNGGQLKDEKGEKEEGVSKSLESVWSIKDSLMKVIESLNEEVENAMGESEEEKEDFTSDGKIEGSDVLETELGVVLRMARRVELKLNVCQWRQTEDLKREIESHKMRILELEDEKRERDDGISVSFRSLSTIRESIFKIIESLDMEEVENTVGQDQTLEENSDESGDFMMELDVLQSMMGRIEAKLNDYKERMKKDKEEMEEEKRRREVGFSSNLEKISAIKGSLVRVIENLDDQKVENGEEESQASNESSEESRELAGSSMGLDIVLKMVKRVEEKLNDYQQIMKKEKRELENSVVSLTEENRDINSLLRIALVEKESLEKSLNKLKGNNDQKRVALLQIAERGLQRVGFGFMIGAGSAEQPAESVSSNASNVSDCSECEEEVVSLASTVEKIMKNLRLEISQLRRDLEGSRSDIERLQSLTEKQAQEIAGQTLYIKDLEDRELMLTQNVEELLMEMKATEEEIGRWREACELEAEAGKTVTEERDKVATILKQELEKTRSALEISNGKLQLKEELAAAAMAAQEAAERSLQLADSRAVGLRERIEELNRQLEEAESRERNNRRRARHICWPWRTLKVNPASGVKVQNVRGLLPEMQALLQYGV